LDAVGEKMKVDLPGIEPRPSSPQVHGGGGANDDKREDVRFEVFTAVTMKNGFFWDVMSYGSCKSDVSEELSASFIKVTRIGELGTTLAVTGNRRKLRRNTKYFSQRASVVSYS
jgi:hypothetical protein